MLVAADDDAIAAVRIERDVVTVDGVGSRRIVDEEKLLVVQRERPPAAIEGCTGDLPVAVGVERGEVRPGADTQLVADVLPAILMHRVIMQRERLGEREIREIMEQVLIPLVEVR